MCKNPICMLLVTVILAWPGVASPSASESATDLEALAWLAGCWASGEGAELSEECWLHPAGGMMLGLNRSLSGGKTSFEFLRIATHGEGLAYLASPGGRQPTPFPLVEQDERLAIFANPEHDFPQRLTYRLGDDGVLVVDVEAQRDGEWRGFQLVWRRSRLEGGR